MPARACARRKNCLGNAQPVPIFSGILFLPHSRLKSSLSFCPFLLKKSNKNKKNFCSSRMASFGQSRLDICFPVSLRSPECRLQRHHKSPRRFCPNWCVIRSARYVTQTSNVSLNDLYFSLQKRMAGFDITICDNKN